MLGFLEKKQKDKKKVGTPTKKVKLNQESDAISQFQIPFIDLVFIKNISKTQNPSQTNFQRQSNSGKISEFKIGQQNDEMICEDKQNDPFLMNKQCDLSIEQEIQVPTKFGKRMNSMNQLDREEFDHLLSEINLVRHNSTFQIADFGLDQNDDVGENIYLNQILTLRSKISLTDANNQNREILRNLKKQTIDEENRLQKDYEIKQNLGRNQHNKEGFICLNKLERIFYYVKKISLGKTCNDNSKVMPKSRQDLNGFLSTLSTSRKSNINLNQTQLISQQIKLYYKDTQGYLIRFYQYWIENNSLYMIFQLGSYSLADKTQVQQKLPQSEVWSILYDVSESLKWVASKDKIHMNIKPGNITKSKGKYKISDPLIDIQYLKKHLKNVSSQKDKFYLAPQVIEFQSFLEGIDFSKCQVYSLGMSILENITSMPLYMRNHSINEVRAYFKKSIQGYSSYLKRLLLRMIEKNYKKRPTFEEILCSNIDESLSSKEKLEKQFKLKRSNSF